MCAVARSRIETCSKLASALVTPMIIRSPAMIRAAFSISTMCSESTGRAGSAATAVSRSSMRRARSAAGSEETPRTVKRAAPSSSTGAVAISLSPAVSCATSGAAQRSTAASVAARIRRCREEAPVLDDRKRTRPVVSSYTAPTSFMRPSAARACASGVSMICRIDQRTFASTPAFSRSCSLASGLDVLQAGRDVPEQPPIRLRSRAPRNFAARAA